MRWLVRAGTRIVKRIQQSIRKIAKSNYRFQELLGTIGKFMLKFTSQSAQIETVEKLLSKPIVIDTPHGPIRFLPHSLSCLGRAKTLMTQEPDSMKWIDRMEPESIFWDVGGNIGNLALYAARRGVRNIWSFEPAAVNYYNLVANCELNAFGDQVTCLQLGFGARTEIAHLNVSQLMSGHSFSFGNEDHRRQKRAQKKMEISAQQAVQVWSIDDFIRHSGAPCPNYLKIDVPGIMTQEILQGATHLLSGEDVTQIQIKTGSIPEKKKGRWIVQYLEAHGFKLAYSNRKQKKRKGIVSTVQRDLVFVKLAVE
jgi:FkbM family methyltransferase